jgi:hypothetical protein
MTDFRPGLVIPVGPGRISNLVLVMKSITLAGTETPDDAVLVLDGERAAAEVLSSESLQTFLATLPFDVQQIEIEQHEPGDEQPRNVGVRALEARTNCTHAWFLDSDVIAPFALGEFRTAHRAVDLDRVLIGPYEWMDPGDVTPQPDLHNDTRWPGFREATYVSRGELNVGLACYSGNLIWPIEEFTRIGGFWNELYHGRCEDGELGLRAVAEGVPISFAPRARGWHISHPMDVPEKLRRNERDVPMLNRRHPWVQGEGVFVVERDGRRFEQVCGQCGEQVNTADWWAHEAAHQEAHA